MSLHPHVPEELRHFGKHLFATFLGLLMALALEGWREHRHEVRIMNGALGAIQAELKDNRDGLQRLAANLPETIQSLEARVAWLETALDRRANQRRDIQLPPSGNIGAEMNVIWFAWDAGKSMGLLRHLTPAKGLDYSGLYYSLQLLQTMQTADLASGVGTQLVASFTLKPEQLAALSPDKVYEILAAHRVLLHRKRFLLRNANGLVAEIDKLLQSHE